MRPCIYYYKTTVLVALLPCASSSQVPNQFLLQCCKTLMQILYSFSSVYTSVFPSVVKTMQKSRQLLSFKTEQTLYTAIDTIYYYLV